MLVDLYDLSWFMFMSSGGSGRFKSAFRERRVQKEYRAIAAGTSPFTSTEFAAESILDA